MKKLFAILSILLFSLEGFSQGNPTTLPCGVSSGQALTTNGFSGDDPTTATGSCGQCCYSGSDLDGDGDQDVSFSVENSQWYEYCNSTGAPITIDFIVDETSNNCNLQGAVFVGGTNPNGSTDATDIDCSNQEFAEFGSNVGGAADGFSFTNITIPAGGCAYIMVDGYAGQACSGFTINTVCPPSCTNPTSFTAGADQTICEGTSVTLNSTVSGGLTSAPGLTYSWSPTTGLSCTTCADPVASPTSTTTYTMTACNGGAGFCCVTDQVTVTVIPNFVANAGPDVTACAGSTITIGGTPTGPAGSTYSWVETGANANIAISGSSTVANPSVTISAGATGTATYTVTVTNGPCVRTDVVVVTVGSLLVNAGADQSICVGSSFNIGGNPTAPAGSTYSWVCAGAGCANLSLSSSSIANPSVTTTAAVSGSVTFTVTATLSGCSNTDAVIVTFNALPATPTATASVNPICAGQSVTLTAAGGSGSGTYSWWNASTGGTNLGSANTLVVAPTATTTYYLQSTDATTGCVSLRGSITITVNATPVANAGTDQTLCAGEVVVLAGVVTNPAGCSPVQTWSVISGTGTFTPNANTLNATFTPTSTGTIQLRLTPCTSSGCSAVADDVIMTVAPSPTVTASAVSNPICVGLINDLNGVVTGGTSTPDDTLFQSFSSNPVTTNIPDNNASGVAIPISVTGISNSTLASTFVSATEVNVDHNRIGQVDVWLCPPGVATTSPFTGCVQLFDNHGAAGDDMINTEFNDLSATDIAIGTPPYTGSFNPTGANTLASLSGQPTNGTWNLVVVDNVNSPSQTGTAGQWDITFGTPVPQPPYTYSWSPTNALSTPNDISTSLFTSGFSAPTTVTYTLTATDFNGCQGSDDVSIAIIDVPTADAGPIQNLCASTSILAGSTLLAGETGLWSVISGSATFNNSASATTTVSGLSNGANILQWTVSNSCGSTSDQVTINVSPASTASIGVSGSSTICAGSSATLVFTLTGTGNYNVVYNDGTSNFTLNNINNGHTVSVTPASTTTYALVAVFDNGAGCSGTASGNVTITVNPVATVEAGIPQTICSSSTVTLAGSIGGGASTGTWSGGTGSFNPNNTTVNAIYTPSAAEITTGTVTLTLTTNDPAGPCGSVSDAVIITINPSATVNANSDQTICAGSTVTLAGSIGGGASSATWTSSSGTFTPNATTLGATFNPSATQVTAGTATLTLTTNNPAGICDAVNDQMIININPIATVDAGSNQTACAGTVFNISGTLGGSATSTTWTSSGTGTFGSTSALSTTYTPSATDITNGSVTLTLTTDDPAGPCNTVVDFITITITPSQSAAFSFSNGTFCQTGTDPTPTISGAGSGTFTFSPAGLSINASTGTIDLSASSLNTYSITYTTPGPCPSSSTVSVTITSAPSANFSFAGPYCQTGTDPIPTFGVGASAGTFSSTAGLVFVSTSTGQVDLSASSPGTYTVDNNIIASGGCSSANASNTITIDDDATVSASVDQTICSGSTVTLSGSIGGSASTGTWTGGGSFSPNSTTLGATYTPSAAELTAGTATLTLTTNDSTGSCGAVNDQIIITINSPATVNANSNQTICAGSTVTLAGSIGGAASSATWSGGLGSFSPGAGTLNATYTPSAGDITAGLVTLTLTSDDPAGPCNVATDQMTITIDAPPVVDAGTNISICAGSTVNLFGSVTGSATTGTWSVGTGSYNPNATTLNSTYTPSAAEVLAGTVSLTLTSADPTGPCNASSDIINITIDSPATVSAGNDVTVCAGSNATFSSNFGGSASSITWTTSGDGTFLDDNSIVSDYIPSANDIAAGTVTLTVTTNDPTGVCGAVTDEMIITITPTEDASFTYSSSEFCINGNNQLPTINGINGGSFFATTGLTIISNTTGEIGASTSLAGTYYVYYLTSGTCFGLDSFEVTINDIPNVSAGPDENITCSANTVLINGSSATLNAQFDWTGPSIVSGNNTATATVDASGTYTLTVTDPLTGCMNTDDAEVIPDSSIPTISAGSDQEITCLQTEVTLNGSSPNANLEYLWTGPGITGDIDALITTADQAGTYTVSVTDTTNGCSNTATVDVILNNTLPVVNAGIDSLITCTTTSLILTGTSSLSNDVEIVWSGPGIFSGGTTLTPTIDATGTYILTVTDTLTGCADSDTVIISFDNSTFITSISSDTTICEGSTVTLIATGGTSYEWSDGSTSTTLTISPNLTTPYFVIISDGICSDILNVNVNVNAIPNIDAGADLTLCETDIISDLIGTSSSGGNLSWYSDAALTTLLGTGATLTPNNTFGTTTYYLSAYINGCTSNPDSVIVTINNCDIIDIEIPTGFTPDGDGVNDVWEIPNLNILFPNNVVEIYGRWGGLIFESEGYEIPWDGKYKDKKMPLGSYYFVIDLGNDSDPVKGTVTIIE